MRNPARAVGIVMLCLALLAAMVGSDHARADEPTGPSVVVDWQDERQHFDGFGGSFAFHKAGSIQRLGEPLASQMLDKIFDHDTGIGLDIVRVMVGDGSIDEWGDDIYDGPTETIMPAPGELVWDQPDWEERKDDFDAFQIWLMQEAQARGVETFMASVWSPPAWMKQNQSVTGGWADPNNRLADEHYQDFADYLAEYVEGYAEHFGIEITHISPTNEPDFSGGYSSSIWQPEELRTFVRDHLGPTFEERGIDTQIVLGEGMRFDEEYALPALQDPEAERYVDVVAAHAYVGLTAGATAPQPNAFEVSNALGKTIWQTEYMNQGAPRDRAFEFGTITDGLRYGNLIANMIETSQLNGYFWWWPVSNSGADGSNLIRLQNDGSPQGGNPTETGEYRTFKRYYTFGQYSRFVGEGDTVLGTSGGPDDVNVTAFKNADGGFSIVVVNDRDEDVELTIDLTGGFPLPPESKDDCKDGGWRDFTNPSFRNQGQCVSSVASGRGDPSAVVPYRTSASENMRKLDRIHTQDRTFTTTLRAGSVTTYVPVSDELPELPDEKDVFSTYLAGENDGQSADLEVVATDEHRAVVTGVEDGSYLRYTNVNFADGSAAGFLEQMGELQMHATVAPRDGGEIEVRLGGTDGTVVGTMTVPDGDATTWTTVSTDIDTDPDGGAYGFHDLYLVFTGADSAEPFDVAFFEFSD